MEAATGVEHPLQVLTLLTPCPLHASWPAAVCTPLPSPPPPLLNPPQPPCTYLPPAAAWTHPSLPAPLLTPSCLFPCYYQNSHPLSSPSLPPPSTNLPSAAWTQTQARPPHTAPSLILLFAPAPQASTTMTVNDSSLPLLRLPAASSSVDTSEGRLRVRVRTTLPPTVAALRTWLPAMRCTCACISRHICNTARAARIAQGAQHAQHGQWELHSTYVAAMGERTSPC